MTEIVSQGISFEAFLKQQGERMRYEQSRWDSFTSWWLQYYHLDVSVAQHLAKAGFYCRFGYTECFSCGFSKHPSFWREGHDPETIHRQLNPDCEFITGQSDNVPIERYMRYERNRLDSFPSWWLLVYQFHVSTIQRLAKAGFYCSYDYYTKCFSCGLCKRATFWQEGHDPETVHRRECWNCKFITGQSDNVLTDKLLKYEKNRLNSFDSSWFVIDYHHLDVSVAQRLAKAGFYCFGDSTECFSCELSKHATFWREGHDPETVHREESPDCKFINGQSDNVPIERWVKYERNRLDSFDSSWFDYHYLDVSFTQDLAKAGFYSFYGDTECFSCGLSKHWSFWWEGHDPETVHREESPC